jgi:hypothetical protein
VIATNVKISDYGSDGFDSDFSSIKAENLNLENQGPIVDGGDGLDVSGSHVDVSNSVFKGSTDKNLSIGENSEVTITDVQILNGHTGIGIKDGSILRINSAVIANNKVGVAAYVKKPCYPKPKMIGEDNIRYSNNHRNFSDTPMAP